MRWGSGFALALWLLACSSAEPNAGLPVAGAHKLTLNEPLRLGRLVFTFVGEERVYSGSSERQHATNLAFEVTEGDDKSFASAPEDDPKRTLQTFGVLWSVVEVNDREHVTIEIIEVKRDQDCNPVCDTTGHCTASAGRCIVSDASCAQTEVCKSSGKCSAGAGACVVKQTEGCKASKLCQRTGACVAKGDDCVAGSAEDCRAATDCKLGYCSLVGDSCAIGSSADCKIAKRCAEAGECSFVDGRCAPGDTTDCKASKNCDDLGFCALVKGSCARGSQADCDKDRMWRGDLLYDAVAERCVPQCRKSSVCKSLGLCTEKDGTCHATSDADCQASDECKNGGKCKAGTNGCEK